jgi:hypothetical protein
VSSKFNSLIVSFNQYVLFIVSILAFTNTNNVTQDIFANTIVINHRRIYGKIS